MVIVGVLLVSALAEAMHLRSTIRGGHLFFSGGSPVVRCGIRTTLVVGVLRAISMTAVVFGALVLLVVDPVRVSGATKSENSAVRRLVVLLDVSPSMALEDAGSGKIARWRRAVRQVELVLRQIDVSQTRISLYAVYTTAKPVVIDTSDANVILTLCSGVPLGFAFDIGTTNLARSLGEVFERVSTAPAESTTLLLLTDGDSDSVASLPRVPPSVRKIIVGGIGDSQSGSFIDGHLSRQDLLGLQRLASRLGGSYFNVNSADLPPDLLDEVSGIVPERRAFVGLSLREWALVALGFGGAVQVVIPLMVAWIDRRLARAAGEASCAV